MAIEATSELTRTAGAEPLSAHDAPTQLRGTIKWFDPCRGFGFVRTEGGEGDVLINAQTLRSLGRETATEGSTVVCEAVRRAKGLQAVRIVSFDDSTAAPARAVHEPGGPFRPATVKWFSRVKGYGFLTEGEGTEDIFLHMEVVRAAGFGELSPGDPMEVSYGDGPKGKMAVAVRPMTGN